LAGDPIHSPEPDDPPSVVPELHVTPVKLAHGPGGPLEQFPFVAPNEMRLCDPLGWCKPVMEVETETGLALHPEKKSPPGREPVSRMKLKSLVVA
jgi:hypothetical protein